MAPPRTLGTHHLRLTVSDLERSLAFYTEVLGFELRVRFGPNSVLLHDATMGLGLNTPWHDISEDERRFDEARVGMDHVRSEEHTSELQSRQYLVCRLLLE